MPQTEPPNKLEPRPYTPPDGARTYAQVYAKPDADADDGNNAEEVIGFADRPPLGDDEPFRLIRPKKQ